MAAQLSVEVHDEMLDINEPHAYDESRDLLVEAIFSVLI